MRSKSTAAVLALLLGGLGVHRFYLGQNLWGIIYLLFSWTFIPAIVAFFEFFVLLFMSEDSFNQKYNFTAMMNRAAAMQVAQSVVVNVPGGASGGAQISVADQLAKLNELRVSGALTEEEFTAQKQKLLMS